MPELLRKEYRDQLQTWIGKTCHFRLLYKISRDGCSPNAFHQQCDGQGATVTVLYNTNNTIYGGYLSQSWHSGRTYITDSEAFLYRLQDKGSSLPMKFPIGNESTAAYGCSSNGPVFGEGQSFSTFSGSRVPVGGVYTLNGTVVKIGNSYNLNGETADTITNNSLKVTDLEVYQVVDGLREEKPWREHPEWTIETAQELKKSLLSYGPMVDAEIAAANILLIGQIGAGKSSFFNSVDSIFQGKVTSRACCGQSEHGVTTMYRRYEVKDSSTKKIPNFRICDTCGFQDGFLLDLQEFSSIVCGKVPDCFQFNPLVPVESDTFGSIKNPTLKDKIHCVAFVIDGSTLDTISEEVLKHIKVLQTRLNRRGLPHVVLLTKIDKICPYVDEDATNTLTSKAILEAVEKVANMMGLPRSHVLPVKNYESETTLQIAVDILNMEAMKICLDFADIFMDKHQHIMATEEKRFHSRDETNCIFLENQLKEM